jgi:hypothetical protein
MQMEQPEVCIISGRQRLVFSLALTMPRCSLRWLGMAPTGQRRTVTDDIDSSTPAGRMMIGVLGSLAKYLGVSRATLYRYLDECGAA